MKRFYKFMMNEIN